MNKLQIKKEVSKLEQELTEFPLFQIQGKLPWPVGIVARAALMAYCVQH